MAKKDTPVQDVPTMNTQAAIAIVEQHMNLYRALADGADLLNKLRVVEHETDMANLARTEAVHALEAVQQELAKAQKEVQVATDKAINILEDAEQVKADADQYAKNTVEKANKDIAEAQAAAEKALKAIEDKNKLQSDEYVQTNSQLVALQRELEKVRKAAAALAGE